MIRLRTPAFRELLERDKEEETSGREWLRIEENVTKDKNLQAYTLQRKKKQETEGSNNNVIAGFSYNLL